MKSLSLVITKAPEDFSDEMRNDICEDIGKIQNKMNKHLNPEANLVLRFFEDNPDRITFFGRVNPNRNID